MGEARGEFGVLGSCSARAREEVGDVGFGQRSQTDRQHPRSDRGKQCVYVGCGEHERRAGRRLLEHFEQRVRGFLTGFLRHEQLGIADDEDLRGAHARACICGAPNLLRLRHEQSCWLARCDGLERIIAAGLQLVGALFFHCIGELLGAAHSLWPHHREEPVDVRMLETQSELARTTLAARLELVFSLAHNALCEPQCKTLFADALRSMDENGARQLVVQNSFRERLALCGMVD